MGNTGTYAPRLQVFQEWQMQHMAVGVLVYPYILQKTKHGQKISKNTGGQQC